MYRSADQCFARSSIHTFTMCVSHSAYVSDNSINKDDVAPLLSGHVIHRFGITETDWHRIKQNIDSKCRTAWRRKQRGLPLMVKAFRGKAPPTYIHVQQQMANQMREQMRDLDSMSDNSQQSSDDVLQIQQVY